MASIIIVLMLTVIISLLTLGFSRLMDRAIQQATGNDLNAAADYAARAGINEVASYLKAYPGNGSENCDDLTKAGKPLSLVGGLSGDENVKFTCILVNTAPIDLYYQLTDAYKSQISKLLPNSNVDHMMISWQSTNRTNVHYPAANDSLYDEASWASHGYPAVLRLTIYPLAGGNNDKTNWTTLKAKTRTVFIYPSSDIPTGNSGVDVSRISYLTLPADGSAKNVSVNCGTKRTNEDVLKTDFDCNVILTDLPKQDSGDKNPYTLYTRLTPLYVAGTNVRFQGVGGDNKLVTFSGTQSIVDVTAKAGSAAKRLQARVDIIPSEFVDPQLQPSEDAAPEYALRSADTICKVFVVPDDKNADVIIPTNIGTGGTYAKYCPTEYQ